MAPRDLICTSFSSCLAAWSISGSSATSFLHSLCTLDASADFCSASIYPYVNNICTSRRFSHSYAQLRILLWTLDFYLSTHHLRLGANSSLNLHTQNLLFHGLSVFSWWQFLFPIAWIHSMVHSHPSFTPPVFPLHQPRFQFLCSEETLSVVKRFLQPCPAPQSWSHL